MHAVLDEQRAEERGDERGIEVDEVGIEVRVGDAPDAVSDEVFAHVEDVTMRIGANFVPIKHEGVIYVRPPLS